MKNWIKLLAMAMVCGLAVTAGAGELKWMTDLPKAQAKAKAEKKLVFLNFTGSDWCGWCMKLDKDVLSKPEFVQYAEKNLVMVFVDFPHKAIPADQKKANEALKSKYDVSGYPTLIVLNGKGEKVFEKVGYMDGVDKWIAVLEGAKKK